MKKIKGLKKAVGDYNRANNGGVYSQNYGYLMYDKDASILWVDEFYSIGHNSWKEYDSKDIVNLGLMMGERNIDVNMQNIKQFINDNF